MALKNISIVAGETLNIELLVKDKSGTLKNLSGGIVRFAMQKHGATHTYILKDCIVSGSHIFVTVSSSETLAYGTYDYEFKVSIDGEIDSLLTGEISIRKSILPTIV